MKILYVVHQFYPEFHSGTEKFLLNLSSSIQRDGNSVQIAAYTYSEDTEADRHVTNLRVRNHTYHGMPVISVKHHSYPIDLHTSCNDPDIYRFAVRYLEEEGPFDLIHIAHPMRLTAFARAAMDLSIPFLITLTDFWLLCPNVNLQSGSGSLCSGPEGGRACEKYCPGIQSDFIRDRLARSKEILSAAGSIVSPSRFLAAIFKKEFPDLKISVIPHGMDYRYLKTNSREHAIKDPVVFAYCGTLSPHKGVHLLIKAFLKLNPRNGILKLFGSSFHEKNYYDYLQKIAGSDERIHFCGTYSNTQIGEIMSGIDAMVLPSLCYENYPLALHEALACSVPVIASNVGGMAEKIEDGCNGYTYRFGDEEDLMQKLRLLLDTPQLLDQLKRTTGEILVPPVEEEAFLYDRLYRAILNDS